MKLKCLSKTRTSPYSGYSLEKTYCDGELHHNIRFPKGVFWEHAPVYMGASECDCTPETPVLFTVKPEGKKIMEKNVKSDWRLCYRAARSGYGVFFIRDYASHLIPLYRRACHLRDA